MLVVCAVGVALALGGCGGSASGGVPSYAGPEDMASKVGASGCGKVDEAASYDGAHYVICETGSGKVQFVAADSEAAAQGAAQAMQAIGWTVEQRGSWAVGARDAAAAKATADALS